MKNVIRLALLLFVAIGVWTAATNVDNAVPAEGLEVGDTAPDFQLKNIDGKMYSLESIANDYKKEGKELKGYIVTFTCNTCPFAVKYEDRLIETHNKMASKGWPIVAIQPNDPSIQPGDSMEKMQERAKEKGFPFVYLMDEGQKVYPQYGASRTPHIFLLDANMKVRYIGALDDNANNPAAVENEYVVQAIEAIESGKKVDPDFTRAIGCTIKTK
jgi:peroxiredoxin